MTPEAAALVALVHLAYAEVEKRQAALPPPAGIRDRLERLFDLDQAGRSAMQTIDLSVLSEEDQDVAIKDIADEITRHDIADQAALKKMLPKQGWFKKSEIGDKAETAAFLIVQHAVNNPALMHSTLSKIEAAVKQGEADGGQFALMYDRIALEFDHKPQRYGSQVQCMEGKWTAPELEDPEHVDERRRSVGLSSEADYLESFKSWPCS